MLNVLAGHDPKDSTSSPQPALDFTEALKADAKSLRIGVPKEFFGEGVSAEVREAVEKAIKALEDAGATVKEVSLPHVDYALNVYSHHRLPRPAPTWPASTACATACGRRRATCRR